MLVRGGVLEVVKRILEVLGRVLIVFVIRVINRIGCRFFLGY